MDTITAAEYVALERKPIVIYTSPDGSFFAGSKRRIGNAARVPPDWIQHGRNIALINADSGHKIYVTDDEILELEGVGDGITSGT